MHFRGYLTLKLVISKHTNATKISSAIICLHRVCTIWKKTFNHFQTNKNP